MKPQDFLPDGVQIHAEVTHAFAEILTPDALRFIASLASTFEPRRQRLLNARKLRQDFFDGGGRPDFLPQTAHIRDGSWTVNPLPADLQDRRVEITGPVDRKMVINALNSGAQTFMADFEDSHTPTWENNLNGQINLRDAASRTITFVNPAGKQYSLNSQCATLLVRPRGWHLPEKHLTVDGQPISGSLFDFGLYLFHNAAKLLARNSGPYFYLPKLESHLEARLWNDVFVFSQEALGIARGTIKATVLIETVLGAFEMDEILYELREHSAGLNSGRWDYIFSCIKKFRNDPDFVLADRAQVTMTSPFMRAYALLLVKTCHKRNAHAMGGMAAQIPIGGDPAANEAALARVRTDKEREANDGYDGTWVAHPKLVPIAREAFDKVMRGPNQVSKKRDDIQIKADDLLVFVPQTPITENGLRLNINIGIQYLGSWLAGTGCAPIHHLMEDAATAEISRSQIWHWIRSPKGVLEDGRKVSIELFRKFLPEELARVRAELGEAGFAAGRYDAAAGMLNDLIVREDFVEFLTLPGYDAIA
ncbi:MAG: malate synthase A [Burkholderiales bacterium]|nr:malate synthase A [Burkholderiales bacterium]MDQ3195490.1 malate synthase A [Pseudomonadota bacterium]